WPGAGRSGGPRSRRAAGRTRAAVSAIRAWPDARARHRPGPDDRARLRRGARWAAVARGQPTEGRALRLHAAGVASGMTRVLVVDDEPQIRRALRVVLRANGYNVTEAASGEAALDAAATEP